MFCQKCGTQLDVQAKVCVNCNARIDPAKFCQKCGESMPGKAKICGACNTRATIINTPLHWLSLGLSILAFITFSAFGGDFDLGDVNIFDWLTIPIALAALVVAIMCIPRGRIILKVISIVLALFYFLVSITWVFQ
ncbi:MAG: zinc ribbon domain-containing protein [Defluviitaleaceae bacterium]|nr:zinc ribbon domain-containing protein [Defluviitaleaceae bacterium]